MITVTQHTEITAEARPQEERHSPRLAYIPQLDSFRFFAVVLVIFSHWLGNSIVNRLPNGFLGVTFFFVLSGYLISSNLLYTKKTIDAEKVKLGQALRVFYIRRSLRIFPLYYLVIFSLLVLAPAMFRNHFAWFALYVPNFLIVKLQAWPDMLSHLWSLGVEEQFYLVWPLLLFVCPYRHLRSLFISTIIVSITYKAFLFTSHNNFFNYDDVLPLSCFDAFAIGALLALYAIEQPALLNRLAQQVPVLAGLLVAAALCMTIYWTGLSFLFGLAVSMGSAFLIFKAITGFKGWWAIILNSTACQYLGKISYGLYMYHNFVPWLVRCFTGREKAYPLRIPAIAAPWLHGPLTMFMVHFSILVIIASISWFAFEKPLNRLKKHFA